MGSMKVWDGSAWQDVAPFAQRASVFVGPNTPAGPTFAGDLWWDTDEPVPPVPGAELAYNQITADVSVTATAPATAQTVIEGTSRTYDGTPVLITFGASLAFSPSGGWLIVQLWDGATDLGTFYQMNVGGLYSGVFAQYRVAPAVGTHNYRIRAYTSGSGTSIIYAGAGGVGNIRLPAFIRVSRV